jgi:hypothetical protein
MAPKTTLCAVCELALHLDEGRFCTFVAATKLPLTACFLAIYLFGHAKTGLSALALKRQVAISYPTT